MTFLHPWALAVGLVAAIVPVVVHLLTRPRPVRLPLSTVRFVREAIHQRRTRHRLRDFLVLLLRTLAVLLIAMTIARPQWGGQPLVSDQAPGSAVRAVILDVSQSMGAVEGGAEAGERARTVAANYLKYRPGLQANLIVAGASARPVFDRPSTNFEALRDELSRCRVLPQRLDVNRALEEAARMLAPQSPNDQRRRELVVVADFQRASWAAADFARLPQGTQIQLESVAPAQSPPNIAVLRAEGRAESSRSRTVQLEVEVGNFSLTARKVVVDVSLGDETWRLQGTCAAGQRTTLSHQVELRATGWQTGEARLVDVDDALAADNVRPLVVQVRPRAVYAIITRQSAKTRPSSSHFLHCALVPDESLGDKASAQAIRLGPDDVDAAALASADLILLDHPGKLPEPAIRVLAGLLRRGRPLLYVAAEPVDATNLKLLTEASGNALQMPVEFVPPPSGQRRHNLVLASVRRDERPFSVFGDQLPQVTGPLRFAGGLSSRQLPNALDDELLATYSDGTACMVLSGSDAGTLAVVNADLTASNLAKSPAFVPLLTELVERMLDGRRLTASAVCGEPLVVNLPAEIGMAAGLNVQGPVALQADPASGAAGELVDEALGAAWHWRSPSHPGVYRIGRDNQTVFAMPVGLPADESQLESLPADVLTGRLAAGCDIHYASAFDADRQRDDFWKWCAAGCVLCLLGELATLLAFRT